MTGITIIDVKVVDLCSKCRSTNDRAPTYKDGNQIPDSEICCIGCIVDTPKEVAFKEE